MNFQVNTLSVLLYKPYRAYTYYEIYCRQFMKYLALNFSQINWCWYTRHRLLTACYLYHAVYHFSLLSCQEFCLRTCSVSKYLCRSMWPKSFIFLLWIVSIRLLCSSVTFNNISNFYLSNQLVLVILLYIHIFIVCLSFLLLPSFYHYYLILSLGESSFTSIYQNSPYKSFNKFFLVVCTEQSRLLKKDRYDNDVLRLTSVGTSFIVCKYCA